MPRKSAKESRNSVMVALATEATAAAATVAVTPRHQSSARTCPKERRENARRLKDASTPRKVRSAAEPPHPAEMAAVTAAVAHPRCRAPASRRERRPSAWQSPDASIPQRRRSATENRPAAAHRAEVLVEVLILVRVTDAPAWGRKPARRRRRPAATSRRSASPKIDHLGSFRSNVRTRIGLGGIFHRTVWHC